MKFTRLFSRKNIIISLILVAAVCVSAVLGITLFAAFAEDREVTISGSSVFVSDNAEVWAHKSEDTYYSMFMFSDDGDSVEFRKDLAYRWFEDSNPLAEEEGEEEGAERAASPAKKAGYFTLEIGFEEVDFTKFTIVFESQQYTATEDEKSVNYIIFTPAEGGVNVVIGDDGEETAAEDAQLLSADRITIAFTGYSPVKQLERNGKSEDFYGVYDVTVSDGAKTEEGAFINIGGSFSDFSSSSTLPVTPMTFKAEFEKDGDGNRTDPDSLCGLVLYSLNNQSFELSAGTVEEKSGHYEGGRIIDTAAPVLCLEKDLRFVTSGGEVNTDFQVIDVLTSSPSSEVSYYLLTTDMKNGDMSGADDYLNTSLFKSVDSGDTKYLIHHKGDYTPQTGDYKDGAFDGEGLVANGAAKICVKLTDTTGTGGKTAYTFLDWYVSEDFVVTLGGKTFVAVAKDKAGASFNYNYYDVSEGKWKTDVNRTEWTELVDAYRQKIAELTAAGENPIISAGSKNYFYLPAANSLLSDNGTAYEDLTFSIYYIRDNSRQQNSSRSADNLSINLTSRGFYEFTIYATDAAGGNMYYYDDDGERVEFSANEIWDMYDDDEKRDYLPWFEFQVTYEGVSVEEPGVQPTAFVGTEYNSAGFDISSISAQSKYRLYIFDKQHWYRDKGYVPTFSEYLNEIIKDADSFNANRLYFTTIKPSDEVIEEEDEWMKDYDFSSSGARFVPQEANAFYCVKLEVWEKDNTAADPVESVLGVVATDRPEQLKGESEWLKNNVASVVLLSVAGAALVGILLIIFIKPRNKGDIDADELLLARTSGKKPAKKAKK